MRFGMLACRVRRAHMMTPAVLKDHLRARMAGLPHEVVAVIHLGSQLQVISIVEVFRGTMTITVVYARGEQGGA